MEESMARAQIASSRAKELDTKRAEAEMRLAMFAENAKGQMHCR